MLDVDKILPPPPTYPQINYRPGLVYEPIQERTGPGLSAGRVTKRDLERYYAIIEAELRTLVLGRDDALAAMARAQEMSAATGTYEWIRLGATEVRSFELLVTRLKLGPAQVMAVLDAAERANLDVALTGKDPVRAAVDAGLGDWDTDVALGRSTRT